MSRIEQAVFIAKNLPWVLGEMLITLILALLLLTMLAMWINER